ncbi:hypothetical protein K7432_003670 [Basidiobolus ranarum]|uniref:Cytochrome b5 heme-binding domain-containing protein n=1 Tax=Basidiobolus ranarum TaxID=34480 RepID=A0ABR2W6N9_9FUNG
MSELTQRKAAQSNEKTGGVSTGLNREPRAQANSIIKLLKDIVYGILVVLTVFFVASYTITDTFTWGIQNKYTNWRNWVPRKQLLLSEAELSRFNGEDPKLPVYIAIDGDVYDVTAGGSFYTKGGSYGFFSGRDAARAYVTGCFQEHLTHDLRGLTKSQLEGLKGWKDFYKNHHSYYQIGQVVHPPIDPKSPIPADCNSGSSYKPRDTSS